jgi:deferrochelatase/peroxidase EfeB
VTAESGRVSRRRLFGLAGAGAAVAGVGVVGGVAADRMASSTSTADGPGPAGAVPFHGATQAGITTPAQDRLHFISLDVTTTSRDDLVDLLREWTRAAERMTAGQEAAAGGAVGGSADAPPEDTGEALGLPASSLTLTVGFGPGLFDQRFGLADRRPPALIDLPAFPKDALDPARCGGDLCVQACADDPQVAVHAIRNLVRMGFGAVTVRWSQLGFGRTSTTSRAQSTPRNLFGFKDGTNNIKSEETDALRDHVWVQPGDGPAWMTGGSYLVARRIGMHIETWDRTRLSEQEDVIGRAKGTGAPLGQTGEFDPVDLHVDGEGGKPLVPEDAHIRLASAESLGGVRILRRGYNFVDGSDGLGHLDAGLFFIAFNRDSRRQFVPMQQALAGNDAMMEYIQHTGSALYACPPGSTPSGTATSPRNAWNSSDARVRSQTTTEPTPGRVGVAPIGTVVVAVSEPARASPAPARLVRWSPSATVSARAPLVATESSRMGLARTLPLVTLPSSAETNCRWFWMRSRSCRANRCRVRTKPSAWAPSRFWHPGWRFSPAAGSRSRCGTQMFTPPAASTTPANPPKPTSA